LEVQQKVIRRSQWVDGEHILERLKIKFKGEKCVLEIIFDVINNVNKASALTLGDGVYGRFT